MTYGPDNEQLNEMKKLIKISQSINDRIIGVSTNND